MYNLQHKCSITAFAEIKKFLSVQYEKESFFHHHIIIQDLLKTYTNKENCTVDPKGKKKHNRCFKILLQRCNSSFIIGPTFEALPPLDSWPGALAATTCLTGALGAGEELGHKLRHIGKLRVGAQHVHGLLNFLWRWTWKRVNKKSRATLK